MNTEAQSSPLLLKKIAFVAMPFGTRATGLEAGKGPLQVDFDALYQRAIHPALTALNYLCIRADHQEGSVIVKDMLEQLVHADLVVADVTIGNANVYYEAGVRHAATKSGCVLICAEWAKLLFDIAQLRQLRFPFPTGEPTTADYDAAREFLQQNIPKYADSIGPVYELTRIGEGAAQNSSELKESMRGVFEFQTLLASARAAAASNDKGPLRVLLDPKTVRQLPGFALRELIVTVRRWLSWGELLTLIEMLPQSALTDPFFLEQKEYALSRQGRLFDAVGLLQTIIANYGGTEERHRTLGIRFTELFSEEPNRQKRRTQESAAIEAFRSGMKEDLNSFLCARHLLVALVNRGRDEDAVEAPRCAMLLGYAIERAGALSPHGEEIHETRAVLAFYEQSRSIAQREVDAVLDRGSNSHSRVRLVEDLRVLLRKIDATNKPSFDDLIKSIMDSLPVPQITLQERVLPILKGQNQRYRKFQQVHARAAREGEVIVSTTSDGEETTKVANPGDFVVKNLTEAQEQYVVSGPTFGKRYSAVRDVDGVWKLYDPRGEVLAIEISRTITTDLNVGAEFFIMAPWGSDQLAKEGDMLVSTVPDLTEVYRIARKEFFETYRAVEG